MSPTSTIAPRPGEIGEPPEPRRGLSRLSLLGIAISVLAVGGVVWWALRQEPPQFPDTPAEWGALAGAIALYAVATLVRGERWHSLLRAEGGRAVARRLARPQRRRLRRQQHPARARGRRRARVPDGPARADVEEGRARHAARRAAARHRGHPHAVRRRRLRAARRGGRGRSAVDPARDGRLDRRGRRRRGARAPQRAAAPDGRADPLLDAAAARPPRAAAARRDGRHLGARGGRLDERRRGVGVPDEPDRGLLHRRARERVRADPVRARLRRNTGCGGDHRHPRARRDRVAGGHVPDPACAS